MHILQDTQTTLAKVIRGWSDGTSTGRVAVRVAEPQRGRASSAEIIYRPAARGRVFFFERRFLKMLDFMNHFLGRLWEIQISDRISHKTDIVYFVQNPVGNPNFP